MARRRHKHGALAPPPQLGSTRARHLRWPKSDVSDLGWGGGWSLLEPARVITSTPPPTPSLQGGGEPTVIAAPPYINDNRISSSFEFLRTAFTERVGGAAEYVVIPALALIAALVAFGIFVALFGKNPLDLYFYMYQGAFGTWFSWQNTLSRAAPLLLTALCTALPAQLGLVIIGGEGALLMGALGATSMALVMQGAPPLVVQFAMVC